MHAPPSSQGANRYIELVYLFTPTYIKGSMESNKLSSSQTERQLHSQISLYNAMYCAISCRIWN